jgi:hypothetical protein
MMMINANAGATLPYRITAMGALKLTAVIFSKMKNTKLEYTVFLEVAYCPRCHATKTIPLNGNMWEFKNSVNLFTKMHAKCSDV